MNTVGITVCVNYSQLLEISLNTNSKILEHIYVITREDDNKTIKCCEKYKNVEILTYDFKVGMSWFDTHQKRYEMGLMNNPPDSRKEHWEKKLNDTNKKAFNKGGGLRLGQEIAAESFPDSFQLIHDCDIVLTDEKTEEVMTDLSEDILYVPRRRRDYSSMKDFKNQKNFKPQPPGYSNAGWGFFQLYKPSKELERVYYDDWSDAAKTDVWFRNDIIKGDFSKKKVLDIFVDHLGREGKSIHYKDFNFTF